MQHSLSTSTTSMSTADSTQVGCDLPTQSSNIQPTRYNSPTKHESIGSSYRHKHLFEPLKFSRDHRARLPLVVSRFLGYRPPSANPPYEPFPIPPFTWLNKIPLRYEVWIFAWIGAFGSILLIEAIMSTSTAFRDVYQSPIIITSFGASAVLIFGVIESPLAQPLNLVLGHSLSAIISVAITRLWVMNPGYVTHLDNHSFYPPIFVNGGLTMATSLLAQLVLGVVHPPGGATGLGAATEPDVVRLSWHYIPVILASTLLTLGWALIVNNLGRRRYPIYWWSRETSLVRNVKTAEEDHLEKLEEDKLRQAEDGGRDLEALYMERMYTEDETEKDADVAKQNVRAR